MPNKCHVLKQRRNRTLEHSVTTQPGGGGGVGGVGVGGSGGGGARGEWRGEV